MTGLAALGEDLEAAAAGDLIGDVDAGIGVERDGGAEDGAAAGWGEAGDELERLSVGLENLEGIVIRVGEVDAVIGVDRDGVGAAEGPAVNALGVELAEEGPVGGEHLDAAVAEVGDD